jgi:two-component system CheB/CheR fusion protein
VLVNRNFEILYLFGPAYDYLAQPVGELTADFLTWAREGLRTKLRIALHDAIRSGKTVTIVSLAGTRTS